MNAQRKKELAEAIRQAAFAILDAEPEVTGMEAGAVAAAIEATALKALDDEARDREAAEWAAAEEEAWRRDESPA